MPKLELVIHYYLQIINRFFIQQDCKLISYIYIYTYMIKMYRILIQSITILDQFLSSQNQVKNSFRYFYLEIPKLPPEEPGWLQSMELQQSRTQLRRGQWHPLQYSCLENPMDGGAWQAAVHGVAKSRTRLSNFTFTFHFPSLEKETATHSSVLAWRIPGMMEPGGLLSMGLHRVRHD